MQLILYKLDEDERICGIECVNYFEVIGKDEWSTMVYGRNYAVNVHDLKRGSWNATSKNAASQGLGSWRMITNPNYLEAGRQIRK